MGIKDLTSKWFSKLKSIPKGVSKRESLILEELSQRVIPSGPPRVLPGVLALSENDHNIGMLAAVVPPDLNLINGTHMVDPHPHMAAKQRIRKLGTFDSKPELNNAFADGSWSTNIVENQRKLRTAPSPVIDEVFKDNSWQKHIEHTKNNTAAAQSHVKDDVFKDGSWETSINRQGSSWEKK